MSRLIDFRALTLYFSTGLLLGMTKRLIGIRTGDLAKLAEVNAQTLRYYERRGLLLKPKRTESGYRLYDEDAVRRIRFIKKAQDLGFTLAEISELLSLEVEEQTACEDIREKAQAKLTEIDGKVRDLTRIRKTLAKLIEACAARKSTEACPILDSLED